MRQLFLLSLAAALLTGCCAQPEHKTTIVKATLANPTKVIIETDLGNDIDDALCLDLAFKGMDAGVLDLLAIGTHKKSPTAAKYADLLCDWYGYPETIVVESRTPVVQSDYFDYTAPPVESGLYAVPRANRVTEDNSDEGVDKWRYPDPVTLYRKILSEAVPKSIAFVSVGFSTTLAQLLDSPADEISPKTGKELVAEKAKVLSIMAGSFGQYKRAEYNVKNDIPACQKLFAEWPGTIVMNPFEIGKMVMYPAKAISEGMSWAEHHPMADAYKAYKEFPYDRPSWDLLSIVYLSEPEMFTEVATGRITVDDEGYTHFTEDAKGNVVILDINQTQAFTLYNYVVNETTKVPNKPKTLTMPDLFTRPQAVIILVESLLLVGAQSTTAPTPGLLLHTG